MRPENPGGHGRRWHIEHAFGAAEQETGLDDYKVLSAEGWCHHLTLALPAVVRAASLDWPVTKEEAPKAQPDVLQAVARPGRSLPEIRCLLWHVVLQEPHGVRRVLAWSHWRRHHQWTALCCHDRRQHLKLQQVQLPY